MFVLGGSWSGDARRQGRRGLVADRQLARAAEGAGHPIYTADGEGVYRADNHGWFIATSGERIFQAGPSRQMHWITTTGRRQHHVRGARGTSGDEMNGNAVLYDVNKILTVGGAPSYENSNAGNDGQRHRHQREHPDGDRDRRDDQRARVRQQRRAPDGQVFTSAARPRGPVLRPDTRPHAGAVGPRARERGRRWHRRPSRATTTRSRCCCPTGTVFSGGGGLCGTCATNHPDGQIFIPPYLFNADGSLRTRPTITSAPSSAQTGQTITVTTGGAVSSFVLMRYGEATHTVDNDQRRIPLSIVSSSGNTYQLAIPSDPGSRSPARTCCSPSTPPARRAWRRRCWSTRRQLSVQRLQQGRCRRRAGGLLAARRLGRLDQRRRPVRQPRHRTLSGSGVTFGTASPVEGSSGHGVTLSSGQIVSTQLRPAPSVYSETVVQHEDHSGRRLGDIWRFGDRDNGAQDRQVWLTPSGQIDFGVYTGQTVTVQSPGSYNDGSWHFMVATQGPDGMHLYVDGQQVASGPTTEARRTRATGRSAALSTPAGRIAPRRPMPAASATPPSSTPS